jgi:adenine C2-methylase RlmN of 23S rRNA A2503 and tRNA A37
MTPEPYTPGSETFTITTTEVLVTLESELDFEVTQSYTLILKVVDTGTTSTGSLVKVFTLITSDVFTLITSDPVNNWYTISIYPDH